MRTYENVISAFNLRLIPTALQNSQYDTMMCSFISQSRWKGLYSTLYYVCKTLLVFISSVESHLFVIFTKPFLYILSTRLT